MLEKPWFEEWFNSPYYHLLYINHNEDEAFLFIEKLIKHLEPLQGCKMLDVACGKGRHSKALAEMGFEVTGIDLSFASINEAKEFECENLHFFQHDMRLPFWINYFNYAFNFFTSFGYFKTLREHNNAIRTIAQSLTADGTLVLDYLNVEYWENHLAKSYEKIVNNVKFDIEKWQDAEHFFKKIKIQDKGIIIQSFTEKVVKFKLADFTEMFAGQGLQIKETYGDYQFGEYDSQSSPRLIMIAKKTK